MPRRTRKSDEPAEIHRSDSQTRRAQVARSRAAGMSFEQIARTVPGVGDSTVAALEHAAALAEAQELRALAGEDAAGALELELGRLDAAALAVEGVLRTAAADPDSHDQMLRAASLLAQLSRVRAGLLKLGGVARHQAEGQARHQDGPAVRRRELQRALATEDRTRARIAADFGVSRSYVTQFAKRYASEIDAIKRDLANQFAGLWIASKENRVQAYQADYEAAAASPRADHHEWIKARTAILHAVSEELGQLPPRATVTVVPVQHILVGVDPEALT